MRTRLLRVTAAVALLGSAASCIDFSGPGLDENPNAPSTASVSQVFTAFQGFQFANLTGDNNRVISVWMRQMAGTGRQWLLYDAPYLNSENLFGSFSSFYTGGGLIDIRNVQAEARKTNDRVFLGIAQVWEAFLVGTLADYWGAVPYREAASDVLTPKYDSQRSVYTAVQALLDSAITNLGASSPGPSTLDLVYGGDKTKWAQAARTLKARYYLHVSPVDNASFALALTNAQQGISTKANDWRTYQSSTEGEQNQWFQFRRQRGTDIAAGKWLIDLMRGRNDPRLPSYFANASGSNTIRGALPGEEDETISWLGTARADPAFRQPLITWAENQLIIAEVQARANNNTAALAALNAVRQDGGLAPVSGLTGNALLMAIMEEKYVTLFQNPEVWDIYKRTCYPNFPLSNGATSIPLRLIYGFDENRTNRANVPTPEPRRNEVNPVVATALDGSACLGQR